VTVSKMVKSSKLVFKESECHANQNAFA